MSEVHLGAFLKSRAATRRVGSVTIGGQKIWMRNMLKSERVRIQRMYVDPKTGENTRPDAPEARQSLFLINSIVDSDNVDVLTFLETEDNIELFKHLDPIDADVLNELMSRLSFASSEDIAKNFQLTLTPVA